MLIISTIINGFLIDKFGCNILLIIGQILTTIFLGIMSLLIYLGFNTAAIIPILMINVLIFGGNNCTNCLDIYSK